MLRPVTAVSDDGQIVSAGCICARLRLKRGVSMLLSFQCELNHLQEKKKKRIKIHAEQCREGKLGIVPGRRGPDSMPQFGGHSVPPPRCIKSAANES